MYIALRAGHSTLHYSKGFNTINITGLLLFLTHIDFRNSLLPIIKKHFAYRREFVRVHALQFVLDTVLHGVRQSVIFRMQVALKHVEEWCKRDGLNVNSKKTTSRYPGEENCPSTGAEPFFCCKILISG